MHEVEGFPSILGFLPTFSIRRKGERCHPLNILDDHSRFNLGGEALGGEAFAGKEIAIRESHLPGQMTLEFRQFRIARLDPDKGVFTSRKLSRIENHEE